MIIKLILSIIMTWAVFSSDFSYIQKSWNIHDCFGDVEFNENAPRMRNSGFDMCIKYWGSSGKQCHNLADRYYGLTAKNSAMQKCVNNSSTYTSCLSAADTMPSYPARMNTALGCVKRFKSKIGINQCLYLGDKYQPLKPSINERCHKIFNSQQATQGSSSNSNDRKETTTYYF